MEFTERYGPWAVIAGGSEGTGRSFARKIAAKGLNCLLIANGGPIEATAEEIRRESGVEVITATIDLSTEDAAEKIFAAVGDREVGLFVNNAGADQFGERFLELEVDDWLALNRVNVDTMLRCVHHFGQAMKARRKGGLLIVNSSACYGGIKHVAIYAAAKAFQLNFAEGLWSELRPYGVDVLTIVLGGTDTPGYRHRRALRGVQVDGAGLASADDVAEQGLARLPYGPVTNSGFEDDDPGFSALSAGQRREKALMWEQLVMQNSGYQPEPDLD